MRLSPPGFFVVGLKQVWAERNSLEGVAFKTKHECSVGAGLRVHPGIIVRVRGELGNRRQTLFSAIVHVQDVLQERYTGGQRSSSASVLGMKPALPSSSEVSASLTIRLPLIRWDKAVLSVYLPVSILTFCLCQMFKCSHLFVSLPVSRIKLLDEFPRCAQKLVCTEVSLHWGPKSSA